nr:MAG TPA: hypothetical protein [Caudoviricetes sp.]
MERNYTATFTADQIELLLLALVALRMQNENSIKLLDGIDGCEKKVDQAKVQIEAGNEIFCLLNQLTW